MDGGGKLGLGGGETVSKPWAELYKPWLEPGPHARAAWLSPRFIDLPLLPSSPLGFATRRRVRAGAMLPSGLCCRIV